MPLFTDQEKLDYESAIRSVHDSFAEPIIYWEKPQRILITGSFNPDTATNYNFLYGDNQLKINQEFQEIQISGVISGRVLFSQVDKNVDSLIVGQSAKDGAKAYINNNIIRVKLDNADYIKSEKAVKFTIRGEDCELISSERPHGLFDTKYHTLFLSKIK